MSRHVWAATRPYTPGTVVLALKATTYAMSRKTWGVGFTPGCSRKTGLWHRRRRRTLDYTDAVRFAGYYLETIRQAGLKSACREDDDPAAGRVNYTPYYRNGLREVWGRVDRTGHRYAAGRNRDNYLLAGTKLLAQAAGLVDTAPLAMIIDKLIEEGHVNPKHRRRCEDPQ